MKIDRVHFRKFDVDPELIFNCLPAYKPLFYSSDWEVVCVKQGDAHGVFEWAKEQATGRVDVTGCHNGDLLVGFDDATDAILFKISYQHGVKVT